MSAPPARPIEHLLDRQLLVVTGKGGTGKTSVAAALAVLAARRGQRVLVCEMDAKGSLAAAFDAEPLEFRPRSIGSGQIGSGLFAMAMNTEDALREYLRLFVKIPLVGRLGMLARTFDFVADAAPGVKEILSLGKLCYEVRERHYDLVVVDGVATGHVTAQLAAPQAIGELIQMGPVNSQTRWMLDIIEDPRRTGVVVVTTPEEMPVNETLELVTRLGRDTAQGGVRVDVAAVVANRVLPVLFDRTERLVFDALAEPEPLATLTASVGKEITSVFEGARLAAAMRATADEQLARLRAGLPGDIPIHEVPELFSRSTARRSVELVADALGAGAMAADASGGGR